MRMSDTRLQPHNETGVSVQTVAAGSELGIQLSPTILDDFDQHAVRVAMNTWVNRRT